MRLKAIVCDLDDTLYNEVDYVLSGFKTIDNWIKKTYGKNDFYEYAVKLFELGERKKVFNQALDSLNIEYDQEFISSLLEMYRSHLPTISLLNDSLWLLDNLKANVKKGIITDGYYNTQNQKLKALKLFDKFNSIVISDLFGRENWKPSPRPYLESIKILNCDHHECVYIGDNDKKDFITAKRLGWLTVKISRNAGIYVNENVGDEYKADFLITDFRDLKEIIELKHLFK